MDVPAVPEAVLARVSELCLALPETEVSADRFAHSFRVRRRVFAYLLTVTDPAGKESDLLVCRADPDEREVLLALGHPFFPTGSGRDRVGIVLEDGTDWDEIGELVTESYRLVAPKKLVALLDAPP